MRKITFGILVLLFLTHRAAFAQVIDGGPNDSTIIQFTRGTMPNFIPDTASTPLWQIGYSHKSFFGIGSTGTTTIMTDTTHPYPIHANNWFTIKVHRGFNTIIDFWHKYQTDSGHAGGVVEFSQDYGVTWQNIKGSCNVDSFAGGIRGGVLTTNFYTFNDTLLTGEPSFTGINNTLQYSRFQFFDGFPVGPKGTSGGCIFSFDTFYIRFRFISDTARDSLAGWIIDSIKIENDNYGTGSVTKISKQNTLNIYPNPSYNGTFIFPELENEQQYGIEVYNTMGGRILKMPYTNSVELTNYAKGMYFYKVTGGNEYYSGQLLIE